MHSLPNPQQIVYQVSALVLPLYILQELCHFLLSVLGRCAHRVNSFPVPGLLLDSIMFFLLLVRNELLLALCLIPRVYSDAFYCSLKAIPLSQDGVGGAPEQ